MKVPGRAWLEFRVGPIDAATSRLSQTAFFAPRGLTGLLYWYRLYPIHAVILNGLVKKLALLAEGGWDKTMNPLATGADGRISLTSRYRLFHNGAKNTAVVKRGSVFNQDAASFMTILLPIRWR